MNHETVRYEKALKKQLRCTGVTKKRLLLQFRSSLSAYLEDHPSPTGTDLRDAFGPPEDMSKVLMESVSNEEVSHFESQRRWKCIAAIALAAVLLVLIVYTFSWMQKPINSYDSVTEGTTTASDREVIK